MGRFFLGKNMDKAFTLLDVKDVRDDARGLTIKGIASTPTPDRAEDIVDPMGAKFSVPMPLLWGHESNRPAIGRVEFARAQKDGIPFEAFLPYIKEPGRLRDRVDEVIHAIKYRLVTAVSIGFKGLEREPIKGGGWFYKRWQWLELSLVNIPANAEATIQVVKSLANERDAVSGTSPSGRSFSSGVPVNPKSSSEGKAMNLQQRIAAFETKRAPLVTEIKELAELVELDNEQTERHLTLIGEVKGIDVEINRLKDSESILVGRASPVSASGESRRPYSNITVEPKKEPPGIPMARVVKCMGMARGNMHLAEEFARQAYPDDQRIGNVIKAAVVAGSTASGNWAAALTPADGGVIADFVEYLRPKTIIGKFGTGGVPDLNRVPFRRPLVSQTGGGAGYWVGEGLGKGLTTFTTAATRLDPLKVANIAVLTKEVLRDSSTSAETWIRNQLVQALIGRMDTDFVDPAKTASAGVSPASITNGATAVTASGVTAAALRTDMKALFSTFIAANNAPTTAVWIMPTALALGVSLMVNSLGQQEFPGLSMMGGTLSGIPVVVSDYVTNVTAGGDIILVNAQDIWLGDEGGFSVEMSTEASLQMDSAPTQSSLAPTASTMVSMFQTNSVAFLAEREINWARARSSAVAYIASANYGE